MKKKYNRIVLLISLFFLLAIITVHFSMPAGFSPTLLPLALVIFSGSSILSFGVFQRILKRSPQQFINYYMLFSFMKMIVLLFLLVIMALIIRSEAMALIIWYGILFAVFIPVETIFAIKLARKKDNTNP